MGKKYDLVKTFVFVVFGILVFIFKDQVIQNEGKYIHIFVGSVIIFYGVESILSVLIKRKIKTSPVKILSGAIFVLLGAAVLFTKGREYGLQITCVVWAVWAIMREAEEIYEKVICQFDNVIVAIINFAESVAVIVLSLMLLLSPTLHHVRVHIILLGIELILEVSWEYLNDFCNYVKRKRKVINETATTKDEQDK